MEAAEHCKRGEALQAAGQWREAFACFREALRLDPSYGAAHNNLGILFFVHGQISEAMQCFREAICLNPDDGDSHCNLGQALMQVGRPVEAGEAFRRALAINPNHALAHFNLGLALMSEGKPAQAVESYRQATRLAPDFADAHFHQGNALSLLKEHTEAIACYRQALRLNPSLPEAHYNLGSALFEARLPEEAAACFQETLRLNPDHVDAHNNLGNALIVKGRLTEAAESFRRALVIHAGHELTLWNRAHLLLLQGDYESGWTGYEKRWALPGNLPRTFKKPRWDGGPLEGKTILVYAEQGLGDTIQFARYLPLVQRLGGKVLFECPPALVNLMIGCEGADQIIRAGLPCPAFDVHIPLLSLPGILGTTLATIPAQVPYLNVKRSLNSALVQSFSIFHIGIVWQGSMNQKGDRRSLPLSCFEPLARIEGVRLVSLQVGRGAEQLAFAAFPVIDLGSRFDPGSLDDLAAAILGVDLVVTVDTAAAHLAGALGVPVCTLLAYAACWRWLLERSDSPWYPTMRLFRQSEHRDWDEVMVSVAAEVRGRLRLPAKR